MLVESSVSHTEYVWVNGLKELSTRLGVESEKEKQKVLFLFLVRRWDSNQRDALARDGDEKMDEAS